MFNVRILTKMDIGIPIFIGNRSNEFPPPPIEICVGDPYKNWKIQSIEILIFINMRNLLLSVVYRVGLKERK